MIVDIKSSGEKDHFTAVLTIGNVTMHLHGERSEFRHLIEQLDNQISV